MGILDTTALSAVLKEKYTEAETALTYRKFPFLALMAKKKDFTGNDLLVAVQSQDPMGVGALISDSQANQAASIYKGFKVTRSSLYGTAVISGEAIRAADGKAGSLIPALSGEIDNILNRVSYTLGLMAFRNGGGAIGQISAGSTVGTATITLANPSDAVNFAPGMLVQASADDGYTASAGTRSAGATVTITSVDVDAGTLTASGNWSAGIAAVAAGDFLYQKGFYQKALKGALAWTPTTAPSGGDSFFGVDRSTDPTRLAGTRHSANGQAIEEALTDLSVKIIRQSGIPDYVFVNPLDFSSLVKSQQAKQILDRSKKVSGVDVGYKAVMVYTSAGVVEVVPDLCCPKGFGFMVQLDTWALQSAGAAPGLLDDDGNVMLRSATADQYEVRVGAYAQFTCKAPGKNGVVAF